LLGQPPALAGQSALGYWRCDRSWTSRIAFFFKAIEKTEIFEEEEPRVLALREMIRMTIYQWVSRGLFEKHKQIFLSLVVFRIMQKKIIDVEYTPQQMSFLLRCPLKTDVINPLKDWLPDIAWYSIQKLIEIEGFELFGQNVEKEAPNRFRDWYNELTPETEKLPLDWKRLEQQFFQKLLVIRCLRPDRITTALDIFIRKTLPNGDNYVDCDSTSSFFMVLGQSYADSTTTTPIFFILSPGANPVKDVEVLARKNGIDPNSDDYYAKINSRIRQVFPENFGLDNNESETQQSSAPRQKSNVVAPATRSTSSSKIRLTPFQVTMAKKFGVSHELMAQKIAELRKGN
jgi:hypothetical protein